ncbi:hypothetical protein WA158_003948 [Blastocystis sp. Blastoise]
MNTSLYFNMNIDKSEDSGDMMSINDIMRKNTTESLNNLRHLQDVDKSDYFLVYGIPVMKNNDALVNQIRTKVYASISYIQQQYNIKIVIYTKIEGAFFKPEFKQFTVVNHFKTNSLGYPLVTSLLEDMKSKWSSVYYGILSPETFQSSTLIHTLLTIKNSMSKERILRKNMLVGHRHLVPTNQIQMNYITQFDYDLHVSNLCTEDNEDNSFTFDFFIFSKNADLSELCPIAYGEPYVERLLTSYCFYKNIQVIDVSTTVSTIHGMNPLLNSTVTSVAVTNGLCVNKYNTLQTENKLNWKTINTRSYFDNVTFVNPIIKVRVF